MSAIGTFRRGRGRFAPKLTLPELIGHLSVRARDFIAHAESGMALSSADALRLIAAGRERQQPVMDDVQHALLTVICAKMTARATHHHRKHMNTMTAKVSDVQRLLAFAAGEPQPEHPWSIP